MKITTHLSFNGQCEEAFRLYERCLGGKIQAMITWRNSPMAGQAPPEWADKILHATMTLGETELAGSDSLPGQYAQPAGFSVLLHPKQPAEAERVFQELAEGGRVHLPIQETFWSPRFGVLVDRFGIPWEISCEQTV